MLDEWPAWFGVLVSGGVFVGGVAAVVMVSGLFRVWHAVGVPAITYLRTQPPVLPRARVVRPTDLGKVRRAWSPDPFRAKRDSRPQEQLTPGNERPQHISRGRGTPP